MQNYFVIIRPEYRETAERLTLYSAVSALDGVADVQLSSNAKVLTLRAEASSLEHILAVPGVQKIAPSTQFIPATTLLRKQNPGHPNHSS